MRRENAWLSSLYVCGTVWCRRAPGGSPLWRSGSLRSSAAVLLRTSEQRAAVARDSSLAQEAGLEHVPTAIEKAADPEDLRIIRDLFGSRAQTLINILLAFDAYFRWYYPLKTSIPFMSDMATREARAFENMCTAIDKQEIYERVSIRSHKSFLPHGAVWKVTKDILRVGDIWALDLSPLELQNAGTKGIATKTGAKRLEFSTKEEKQRQRPTKAEGPANLTSKERYSTTLSKSTLRTLIGR